MENNFHEFIILDLALHSYREGLSSSVSGMLHLGLTFVLLYH